LCFEVLSHFISKTTEKNFSLWRGLCFSSGTTLFSCALGSMDSRSTQQFYAYSFPVFVLFVARCEHRCLFEDHCTCVCSVNLELKKRHMSAWVLQKHVVNNDIASLSLKGVDHMDIRFWRFFTRPTFAWTKNLFYIDIRRWCHFVFRTCVFLSVRRK